MKPNVFSWMLSLWRPHRALVLPLIVLSVANAVAAAALPLASKQVFDALALRVTPETLLHTIVWLATLGLIRFFVYAVLQNMRAWVNTSLEWTVRTRLFRHVIRLGPGFYNRFTTGDLITRLTDDISDDMKLSWFLCSGVFRCLEAVCVLIGVAIAMLRLNVHLALWCLVPLPILFWVFTRVSSLLDLRFARLQGAVSRVNSELEATFSGIRLVKSYTMERRRETAFQTAVEHRQGTEIEATRVQVMMESLYMYSWQIAAATVLLMGGRMVIGGEISVGDFVAFNGFALTMTFPMFDLGTFLTKGRQSLVFIDRLRELEAFSPEVTDGLVAGPAQESSRYAVDCDDVSYAYSGTTLNVLKNVSMQVKPGEFVAIVGRVGQGKTTLMRLLLRLVDPSHGEVRRDGQDLRSLPLKVTREGVGYVPQDPIVLSDSLLSNIRFGRPDISLETARWAVSVAQLQPDVDGFKEGLDTQVGPRGTQLSGGQKQRLSLARALAGRPQILLLDDCTASLDASTEAVLWDALRRELPDTTIVGVTHRTAELERADNILVLGDGGAVVQAGTHADLIARSGEYRKLYERYQQKETVVS